MSIFYFRNGCQVKTVEDLFLVCRLSEEDAIYHLMSGHFEPWLNDMERYDLAEKARKAREQSSDESICLIDFVNSYTPKRDKRFEVNLKTVENTTNTEEEIEVHTRNKAEKQPKIKNLIEMANILLEIIQYDEDICQIIEESRKKFEAQQAPTVQLYGVSQAGKSTLISCLTLGEQYIPIGTGKATTAVKIELLNVDSPKQHRAEIEWFSSEELLMLVEQPLDFYIKMVAKEKGYQKPLTLSKKDRDLLWDALQAAKRARQDNASEAIVGGGNDLAIAEVILRHYEEYARVFNPSGFILYNFSQLPDWTRQPHEWGNWEKRAISDYTFDELRSFFTKKVRLYVTTPKVAEELRLLDTPGFGVSNLHDDICRNTQKEAEAIILVLGTQFTTSQLKEIKQLALGLYDNLFIIWNPKVEAGEHSQEMLEDMLAKLREETGITVPKSRTVVANLHLALRAMQWEKITKGRGLSGSTEASLHEMFSRKYPKNYFQNESGLKKYISYELRKALENFVYPGEEVLPDDDSKITKALEYSGWSNVLNLLNDISKSQEQRRETEFALSLLRQVTLYLERFPTPREEKRREETLKVLKTMLAGIEQQRGSVKEHMEKKIDEKDDSIFDEFLSYLVESHGLESLKSSAKDRIESEIHFSIVSGKVENLVKDYVNARCSVWIKGITGFTTDKSREWILSSYKKSISDFEEWVSEHQTSANSEIPSDLQSQISLKDLLGLEFPSAENPEIDLKIFDESIQAWTSKITSSAFSPDWISKFVTWVAEVGTEIGYQTRRLGNWISGLFSGNTKETEKKPSFDRNKAVQSTKEKINTFLSKQTFENIYKLGKDPSLLQVGSHTVNTPPQDLASWVNDIERQIEISNRRALLDRCDEFCRAWRIGKDSIKSAVSKSFTTWSKSVQSTLSERYDRLRNEAKPLVDQSTLEDIEALINGIQFMIPESEKSFHNDLSKVMRLIKARKQQKDSKNVY